MYNICLFIHTTYDTIWYATLRQEEDEESDEEGPIYNPLNLPLGWDGKPIPYWLYKLHGLGVEFKCEICGDFSYKGRRCVCVCLCE